MERLGPVSVLHVAGDCLDVQEGELDGEAVFTLACAVEVYNVSHTLCSDVFVSTFTFTLGFLQLYDHRCVHSWPLGSTDHVTCTTHFHTAMGKYCAVRNSNVSCNFLKPSTANKNF